MKHLKNTFSLLLVQLHYHLAHQAVTLLSFLIITPTDAFYKAVLAQKKQINEQSNIPW